ncbi:ATP-binding protein [Motiliproteus sp. MSK22-1]|uniref:ATP-binding protein n=1 Tax=Motiliproteus sp. MSK22-1 TaxID=1897630 RepID=UPI0009777C18|nr:ATP-binding protein [Motiliproteus sp. MSK22-1]OMH30380.1 hypothetical protein BGP75_18550 [Motiliproteus sp. MSK22-1]
MAASGWISRSSERQIHEGVLPERLLIVGCIIGLLLLALAAVASHLAIQRQIQQQQSGSVIVNLSGRQRMLSQKLAKSALRILSNSDEVILTGALQELHDSLRILRETHQALVQGDNNLGLPGKNSTEIQKLFAELSDTYQQITEAGERILIHGQPFIDRSSVTDDSLSAEGLTAELDAEDDIHRALQQPDVKTAVAVIIEREGRFLLGMDRIVSQYTAESQEKLEQTQEIETLLFYSMLLILLLEALFIFRPLIQRVHTAMSALRKNEQDLINTTEKLEFTIDELRDAQENLLDVEKKAVLASVVAGVTHDVNTPIGVGITAASTLQLHTREFSEKFHQGTIRRSDMESYQEVAVESIEMILQNLTRAAELIANFKQVAVDQSSEQRRHFNLKQYLDDIVLAMNAKLRTTQHQVKIHCPENLELDSYPGALYQILSNLIMNSLIHGFEHIESGTIQIDAKQRDGDIELIYQDDGCGISYDAQKVLFDAFYTTKKDQGGTGIGTHVIKNLVETSLGGEVQLSSEPGKGVRFSICFPVSLEA